MDNKELSLEEILADETGKGSSEEIVSDEISDTTADDVIEDAAADAAEELPQKRMLTADEILSGESLKDIEQKRDELTVDEIIADDDADDKEDEDADRDSDEDHEEEYDDEYNDEEYDDDEFYDDEPTVIMPKNGRSPHRYNDSRRARPRRRRRVHRQQKPSKFNGTIFGGIILTCIILTVSIVLAITGISVATEYYGIGKDDKDVIFNIPEGSDNKKIADLLYENGIIRNKTLFLMALKIEKPATIYPGDITLQASMGYPDIIEKLATQRKKLKTVDVTITEGMNLLEVAKLLEKKKVCKADDFLFEFNKSQGYDFEKDLNINKDAFYKMEGYFFPETYNFYVEDTAYNVTKIVREQFQSVLNADIMRQIKASNYNLNQIITIASIVQLEAGSEKEMPKVASVFLNRLKEPDTYPNLQSNTTDKYIKEVINKKAIDSTSAAFYANLYDTYKCTGLPASPICNPGLAAIKAVLNPEKTDYYFFCNNLATGETFYARTNEEHEINKKKAGLA